MEGTRLGVFQEIDQWLADADAPNVLWLDGPPGSGKSTIASSLISKLTELRRLGSSFAFKRGDVMLSNPSAVWRTVAHDLASNDAAFAKHLVEVLKGRRSTLGPDITHFEHLIKGPFTNSYNHSQPHTPRHCHGHPRRMRF